MNNASLVSAFLSLPALLANFSDASPVARRQEDASSSSSMYGTRFEDVTWDNAAWTLTTTNLDQGHYQSRISLANGYIGINLAALGPFFEYDQPVDGDVLNGWPLFDRRQAFATVGGFWDVQPNFNGTNFPWLDQYGWDSAISGIPHWAGIAIQVGDAALYASTDASEIQNFTSYIDMKHALMNWEYTWAPQAASLHVSYQTFLHKVNVNEAFVSLNITAAETVNITLVDVLDGDCATRSMFVDKGSDNGFQYSAVNPDYLPDISAYVYSNMTVLGGTQIGKPQAGYNATYVGKNESSYATALSVTIPAGETVSVFKYVGIASTDAFSDPKTTAKNAASAALSAGYAARLASHTTEWATLFPETAVDSYAYPENGTLPDDDNIIEDQIMAVANPFYLLQNTISEAAQDLVGDAPINTHSIAVGGLGSDSYAGQIFWDAEIWMAPGLVATFPYAAKGIANYRVTRSKQAQENIATAYQSSKNDSFFSPTGAIFPWTSGRYGNCTATGPCWDYEYHINGDIGMEFVNYWLASGDTQFFETDLLPIFDSVALTFSELLQPNNSEWILTNMTDPDEFANHVDNGAFTMALIAEILQDANKYSSYFNGTSNNTWNSQANRVTISRNANANILLEYTGMNGTVSVKQADVVLVTYPLSYSQNYSTQDSISDLNYYANKQSPDGPGMTYSVFSIVANEVTPSGCSAYTYQQTSTQPYARAPWFQLSEQLIDNFEENGGFHPAFPFLTGHGGANQVVLFGYLGFRYTSDWILHIEPNLPPQIPQITYRTFYWHGWPISAFSNQTHTTLTRDSTIKLASGAIPNSTFSNTPIPVHVGPINGNQTPYSLPINGTLKIPNRQTGNILTTPNNLAQCQPAHSTDDIIPGQFPISAVDGALSTKWQPALANQSAQLTISLPTGHRILAFDFDWADAPAYNYSIWLHNDSSSSSSSNTFGITSAQPIINGATVQISNPFNVADVAVIAPIGSNTSTLWMNGTQMYTTGNLLVNSSAGDEVWSAKYATLEIWGSLYNGSLGVGNMSGSGATVAEWNVIVDTLNS